MLDNQLSFFDNDFTEEIFIEEFESPEVNNESEEDIENIDKLDLYAMAITGTDWTTETIVNQIEKQNIILNPDFQRRDAWTNRTKSRFIESLFLGLPIPQIILAEQKGKKGKFFVIDGKQRLLSLQQFVLGKKDYLKLSGLEVKTSFNKLTYADIEEQYPDEVEAFNNQPIRTVVVKNWPSFSVLYLLFLRLNTGSVKLSPQELRQALYPGEFTKFANLCSAKNKELQKMLNLKKPDFRMRDVEIFIRYFGFKYFKDSYSGSMQRFLDDTCNYLNENWDDKGTMVQHDTEELSEAIKITLKIFGKHAFKKYKNGRYEDRYNRSVIDIMLYYFSQSKIREKIKGSEKQIKKTFEELCSENIAFLSALELTTKSTSAVANRFNEWGQALKAITSIDHI